jgi:hypothetical protein
MSILNFHSIQIEIIVDLSPTPHGHGTSPFQVFIVGAFARLPLRPARCDSRAVRCARRGAVADFGVDHPRSTAMGWGRG